MSAAPNGRDRSEALNQLTVVDALDAIDRGECSAEEIARACLDRIAAREPVVGAWQWLEQEDEILARVRAAAPTSALRGLMCGIKDTIDTGDMPTEYGSALYLGHRPATDAAPVALLRRAGGVIAGKTVATEFAYFAPGKTVNPHDAERSPGGSSSGSAAAVADGMVPLALGAQTAGSVIRPAAYCGCIGYVASSGELPLTGVHPLSPSLDTLGILARSVEDVLLVRRILADGRAIEQSGQVLKTPHARLAVTDGTATGPIDEDMIAAVNGFAGVLEAAGASVQQLDLDGALGDLVAAHEQIMAFEAAREMPWVLEQSDGVSPQLRELIDRGWQISPDAYGAARERVISAGTRVDASLASVDAIIAPAAPGVAPRGRATGSPHASRPWQALTLPTVTLPVARSKEGLPLGVQLIGVRHRDDELLLLAAWAHRQLISSTNPITTTTSPERPSMTP